MIFLNISNHPSDKWDEKQRAAALAIADEIVDIPFPMVCPKDTQEDIQNISHRLIWDIFENGGDIAYAMVQGEFTLTFELVKDLQKRHVICMADCSERNTIVHEDGTKTVQFGFVQFREYSL